MSKVGFYVFILLFSGLYLAYYVGAYQILATLFKGVISTSYAATNRDANGQLVGYAK